jgi:hypothetical protein
MGGWVKAHDCISQAKLQVGQHPAAAAAAAHDNAFQSNMAAT